MRAWNRTVAAASAVTVAVGLLAAPGSAHATPASRLAAYERQPLTWTACAGIDDPSLRCATVRVPLDYTHPEARAITVTISRLAAGDPARRRGVLLTTGGGPGGPGVPLPLQLRAGLDPAVLAAYDVVGFDIRFLERSTPITCGQPAEEPGGFWVRSAAYQSFKDTSAQAAALAADCARNAGWALPFATTANVARDMDVIRAVLGERKISYLGGSAAALVGVAYHTLFPDRVDRLVLDSPPDLDKVWRPFELSRTAAMEDNYRAFLAFLAAGDATYHLGGTPAAVDAAITGVLRRATATPIVAGDHAWTASELGNLLVFATFFEHLWQVVAIDFVSILSGAAPPVPLPIQPAALPGTPGVPADNHTAVNLAYRCGDHTWPRRSWSYRVMLAVHTARYPTYGPANANLNPCAFWPVGGDKTPSLSASRPGRALILAALGDAAVPPANSVATHAAIRGSRLVTIDRRVHTPLLSGQADACMAGAVTAYLRDGVLPEANLAC
ncbi:MAG TPA: alpha/beta fold hydrolase [Actinoplanes sp.]|nr:alpha/beta fold hydrolase [Actinoplanes sp.]